MVMLPGFPPGPFSDHRCLGVIDCDRIPRPIAIITLGSILIPSIHGRPAIRYKVSVAAICLDPRETLRGLRSRPPGLIERVIRAHGPFPWIFRCL